MIHRKIKKPKEWLLNSEQHKVLHYIIILLNVMTSKTGTIVIVHTKKITSSELQLISEIF